MEPAKTYLAWWEFYEKLQALAGAYLRDDYDCLVYVVRGGMTPAHRLAHVLGLPPSSDTLKPIYVSRHRSDAVQAIAHAPTGDRPPDGLEPGRKLLLVEDTIGAGATLARALALLETTRPALVDVLSVGFDHHDWRAGHPDAAWANRVAEAVVGFDYWGWMVFPWENQAIDARGAGAVPRGSVPLPLVGPLPPGRGAALPQWFRAADRPGGRIVTLGPARPADWHPEHAEWRVLEDDRLAAFDAMPPGSVDLVVVGGVLASRLPLAHWTTLGQAIARTLAPGGRMAFDCLDRRLVASSADIVPGWEYFTPDLAARLFRSWGLEPHESYPGGRLVAIASGVRGP